MLDQIGRAYGVLTHAHSMSSKEALNLLSAIKLGVDLQLFPDETRIEIDQLFIETQPGHLQRGASEQKMTAEARDALRARLIRAKLRPLPEPDLGQITSRSEANEESHDE